jgi:hypothetical protein
MTETETPAECGHNTLVLKADPATTRQRLRDQFALHAPPVPDWFTIDARHMDRLVTWAYTYADAMLRQREETT